MLHLAVAINDKDKNLIPTLVSIFISSKCYHTELVFTDGKVLISDPKGTRFIERTYDRYHWVLIPLPWIIWKEEQVIREWAEEIVKSKPKYDWIGALFGGIHSSIENPKKWFCSELCAAAIRDYTPPLQKNVFWTPEKLWKTVSDYLKEIDPRYSEGWKFRYRK